jgi:uroporphyrin-III C-methyltransferase/precorrin-2 dehydrogenase/sirohydrochlorin ferrochelatase
MVGAPGAPPGIVYLVDAGPGPADLVTMRAHRLLGEADVIVHDPAVSQEVLALARRDARVVPASRDEVGSVLGQLASSGNRVVWLERASDARAGLADEVRSTGIAAEVVSSWPG